MKKTVIVLGLLSILTTMSSASIFTSLSYGQSLENNVVTDDNLNDISFENAKSLKLKIGFNNFPIEEPNTNFGFYMGLDYGLGSDKTTHIYNGNAEEFEYALGIWTGGITYAFNNNIVLFGGAGIAIHQAKGQLQGEAEEDFYFKSQEFNANGGAIFYFSDSLLGIIAEYDSAPQAVSIGLAMRF